ncbi:MAG: RNA polymerase sigma factor [Cyclobacteriaceae bacterium]
MSEEEFKHIVIKYQDRVYNTCLGFFHNEEDAEDLAQEVFIEVHKSYDTFLAKAQLGTWVYKIAVNKCLEEIRKRKSEKRGGSETQVELSEQRSGVSDYHPGISLENKERATVLMRAIDLLPESQRAAFTLSKIEGLSYEEIGKVMDKSISSIESLLHRAKSGLQKLLKSYYEEN